MTQSRYRFTVPRDQWDTSDSLPSPAPSTPTPAPRDHRRLLAVISVILLPVLAGASLWYGLRTVQITPATSAMLIARSDPVLVRGNGTLWGISSHPSICAGQRRIWLQPYSAAYWSEFRARGCAQCHDAVTNIGWGYRGRR